MTSFINIRNTIKFVDYQSFSSYGSIKVTKNIKFVYFYTRVRLVRLIFFNNELFITYRCLNIYKGHNNETRVCPQTKLTEILCHTTYVPNFTKINLRLWSLLWSGTYSHLFYLSLSKKILIASLAYPIKNCFNVVRILFGLVLTDI